MTSCLRSKWHEIKSTSRPGITCMRLKQMATSAIPFMRYFEHTMNEVSILSLYTRSSTTKSPKISQIGLKPTFCIWGHYFANMRSKLPHVYEFIFNLSAWGQIDLTSTKSNRPHIYEVHSASRPWGPIGLTSKRSNRPHVQVSPAWGWSTWPLAPSPAWGTLSTRWMRFRFAPCIRARLVRSRRNRY